MKRNLENSTKYNLSNKEQIDLNFIKFDKDWV